MLTENDITRKDALEIYETIRNTNLKFIGFKDIGLPLNALKDLTTMIKKDKRTIFLEIVSNSKKDTIKSAEIGVDLGVDYLIGGTDPNIEDVLKLIDGTNIKFFPYIGEVIDHPCKLRGSIDEFITQYRRFKTYGIDGINLLGYRHEENSENIIKTLNKISELPLIVAGDIKTKEQILFLIKLDIWGFTIGTAIFNKRFVPDGDIKDNINFVLTLLNNK
jgi:hypothetical protein